MQNQRNENQSYLVNFASTHQFNKAIKFDFRAIYSNFSATDAANNSSISGFNNRVSVNKFYPYEKLVDDNGNALPVITGPNRNPYTGILPENNELNMQRGLYDQLYYQWNYILKHPGSPIAFDMANNYFLGFFVDRTVPQIDTLICTFSNDRKGTARYDKFKKAAEKAKKTAIGTHYQDFEFDTPKGNKVKLSSLIPEGKYVMLEFWASWCGPCRGEIPHLREVNKNKSNNFEIISISLDEDKATWKKAMSEEKMVWTQLNDPSGFEGEIAKAYNILGIPYSLLLDTTGHIIQVNTRGAALDVALEDLNKD